MTTRRDIGNLFTVIAAPGEVFRELRERPAWGAAAVILIGFWLCVGWLKLPAIESMVRTIFSDSYNEHSADIAMMTTIRFLRVQLFVIDPLSVLIRWLFVSTAICVSVIPLRKEKSITLLQSCSMALYAEVSFAWMAVFNLIILYYRGFEQLASASDVEPLRGLDLFFSREATPPLVRGMLADVNLFSLWYIVLLAIGIFSMTGISRRTGGAIAGAVWLCWIALRFLSPVCEQALTGILVS